MSFLDEVFSTTKNVAEKAGKKTDEAVKLSKLKIKKAQINGDIKTKYEKLGAMIYQMAKADEKDNDSFDAAIAEIDEAFDELNKIEKQIDDLNNVVACEKCGAKTDKNNNYCPKCGAKLPEIVEEPAEETPVEETPAEAAAEEAPAETPAVELDKKDEA